MDGEVAAYTAFKAAIVNYGGYTTPFTGTTFDVESFDDIPNGTMHNGYCPFIAFKGGVTDGFTNMAGDLYSGEMVFEIMLCLSQPLIKGSAEWNLMKTWTGEVERAVATLNGGGFTMPPSSDRSNPISLNQMITRELSFDCQFSECRAQPIPPEFQTDPVISGSGVVGELITLVRGTATGSPTPVITSDFELDGAPTGDTDLEYTPSAGDIGKFVGNENTATSDAGVDTADSNLIEIVSGFVGVGDIVALSFGVSTSQPLTKAYSSSGNKSVAWRNPTAVTTGEIGWVGDKFDVDAWDSTSNNGTELIYATVLLDQISTNDAVQTLTTRQPLLLRDGSVSFDGIDDFLTLPMNFSNTTDMSFMMVCNINSRQTTKRFFSSNFDLVLRDIGGVFDLRAPGVASSTVGQLGDTLYDGEDHMIIGSYNSTTGWVVQIDGQSVSASAVSGALNHTLVSNVGIFASTSGSSALEGSIKTVDFDDGGWTAQEMLDTYNQWEANEL